MSRPYNDIKKAIEDAGKPITEKRPRLPNWFECVYPEDYKDGGCGSTGIDPAASTKDTGSTEGEQAQKSDLSNPLRGYNNSTII
jgi:hypothetical protein